MVTFVPLMRKPPGDGDEAIQDDFQRHAFIVPEKFKRYRHREGAPWQHWYMSIDGLKVAIDYSEKADGRMWVHVSFSRAHRIPSYDDMAEVKRIFIGDENTAYQVFPPASKHVNHHPNCLHLFSIPGESVTPDFTWGTNTI